MKQKQNKKKEIRHGKVFQTVQPEPKTEPKAKQDFEPKVKTSIVARPIFKSSYERYEWHMQNGCICQEDRTWLTNYIKSDEYKEIYGKEQ